ncbi:D-aminoacyl-tRNA deacylase 2-like isoform X1 [Amphiura filiformis]|uniref:D-aminoacyl-tRNA deacylase 2-like isoform X1 n=2 Tax=Amphiura filiformis TaxID=82378 RepID=UPI003B20F124
MLSRIDLMHFYEKYSPGIMASSEQDTSKSGSSSGSNGPLAKLIIQQCLSARLQVKPPSDDEEAAYVEVERGIVVYVCFLKGASKATVEKMVKTVLTIRLSEKDTKLASVSDLPGNVLIVPQATLGGKAKGKMMQYHSNIAKDQGLELYTLFCHMCQTGLSSKGPSQEAGTTVKNGTYGNRQVLSIVTNGPFTHIFEF